MIGKTLTHFEIIEKIGAGGMGEVWKARDTVLNREVAIKILPEGFAQYPERMARFHREAKLLASLQHPNIAGIYGLESEEDRVFLVMELAEGVDLSRRIADGPMPQDDVLDIARQLAAGLEEAHESGIVHRDLKPANIKVGSDGKVKILDFGLARAFAGETAEEENPDHSPTITAAMSKQGMILGTAAYMSPEQARGRKVDRRADIWSFGTVLFEMLTGKRLFEGETISDTLAAVLRADIEWDLLPDDTSPGLRRLLERCLERDPLRRLRDIGEARIFLESGAVDSSLLTAGSSMLDALAGASDDARGTKGLILITGVAVVASLALGLIIGRQVLSQPKLERLLNTVLPLPDDGVFQLISTRPGPAALSPDGTMVTYTVRDEAGTVRLYLRHLDKPDGAILSGTEGAVYPFWSADSRFIGFEADQKLKKVAVTGGPPVSLCNAANLKGGTWNEDGVILFAPDHESGLHRVSASGGEPIEITTINKEEKEDSHRHPRFLPDGKRFLFIARIQQDGVTEHRVYLGSIDGEEPRLITTTQSQAEFSRGNLLTVREGTLLAAPFDPKTGKLGDFVPLMEEILMLAGDTVYGLFSSTTDGMLVYQTTSGDLERRLEWVGPDDVRLGQVGEPGEWVRPRISPDGTRAVVELNDLETDKSDLWLVDLESGLRSRFTFDPGSERAAIWTPDGTAIAYASIEDSIRRIIVRPIEGTGEESVLYEGKQQIGPSSFSPDGKKLIVAMLDPDRSWDICAIDVASGTLEPVVATEGADYQGMISPDGRWLAYASSGSGGWNIFVQPVSGGGRRWQVNQESGFYPFWGPDAKTLYYLTGSGEIEAVPVDGSGSTFRAGAPQPFLKVSAPDPGGLKFSLHPDGKRILRVTGDFSEVESGNLHLVTDWQKGLAS